MFFANDAGLVDHERFRDAVHAEIDTEATVAIGDAKFVGVAELLEPAERVGALVLVVQADDQNTLVARQRHQQRMLFAARGAPGRPHVE